MNEYIEDPEDIEFEEGEVEYDLRDYERASFGKAYKHLNDYSAKMFIHGSKEKCRGFFAVARTLTKMIVRYVDDEELVERAEECQELCEIELNNMTYEEYTPGMPQVNEVREVVEDLRHAAGLNLPRKKQESPEDAWKGGA
jgi:hypothetical protein